MDHTLRVYNNPFKQAIYLLVGLGFVAAGILMLRDPEVTDTIAYLIIGFFGLGAAVFLYSLGRELLVRRPLLQVDAHGWTYAPALRRNARYYPWQDIGRVALFYQHLPSRFRTDQEFYLVLEERHPDQ